MPLHLAYLEPHSGSVLSMYDNDMYCLVTINIDVNGRVCGALVQFGCYQHRHVKAPSILG